MRRAPHVSIIDDDESLRHALAGLVRAHGFEARDFPSAESFLAAGAAHDADCIVTDIHMPGLSGLELKARLLADGCAAPVIMITARHEPLLREKALASGAVCVLHKPFEAEELIACLNRALTPATP